MYPDTSCLSGTHVSGRPVSWCKRGIIDLDTLVVLCEMTLTLIVAVDDDDVIDAKRFS